MTTSLHSVASSNWGLSLCYLINGDLDKAMDYFYEAVKIDYKQYNPEEIVNYPITEPGEYGEKYKRIYPQFAASFNRFIENIKAIYGIPELKYKKVSIKHSQANSADAKSHSQ